MCPGNCYEEKHKQHTQVDNSISQPNRSHACIYYVSMYIFILIIVICPYNIALSLYLFYPESCGHTGAMYMNNMYIGINIIVYAYLSESDLVAFKLFSITFTFPYF